MPDLNANDLDAASRIIAGTARSMGVDVDGARADGPRQALPRGLREGRPRPPVRPRRGRDAGPRDRLGQVRRDRRAPHEAGPQRPPRRGAAARHAGASERPGQGRHASPSSPRATQARAAQEAGAEFVGAQDLADRVEEGWTDFDVAISTPALMGPVVSKLGRVLGPQGKMPNPKVGTVTDDIAKAVGEAKSGKVEYRTDRNANIHLTIGKASFGDRRAARELRRGDRRDQPREAGRLEGPLHPLDHADHGDGPRRPRRPGEIREARSWADRRGRAEERRRAAPGREPPRRSRPRRRSYTAARRQLRLPKTTGRVSS